MWFDRIGQINHRVVKRRGSESKEITASSLRRTGKTAAKFESGKYRRQKGLLGQAKSHRRVVAAAIIGIVQAIADFEFLLPTITVVTITDPY